MRQSVTVEAEDNLLPQLATRVSGKHPVHREQPAGLDQAREPDPAGQDPPDGQGPAAGGFPERRHPADREFSDR